MNKREAIQGLTWGKAKECHMKERRNALVSFSPLA